MGENKHILSYSDLDYCETKLNSFQKNVYNYLAHMEAVISSFDNEPVVLSYYSSGSGGKDAQDRIRRLFDDVRDYHVTIDDGLVPETKKYIADEREALNRRLNQ